MSAVTLPDPRRLRLAAAASLAAAVALTFALVSPTFWQGSLEGVEFGVGLVRTTLASGGQTSGSGLAIFGAVDRWVHLGAACFAAAALAALAQVAVAIAALRGGHGRAYQPRFAATIASFAFSLGAVFVVSAPPLGLAIGPALWAYFLGGAVAIAASVALHPAPPR